MGRVRADDDKLARRRQARFGGFVFTEGVHPAGTVLPWHWHETPTICCVLRGAFTEVCGGDSVLCVASCVKFMPAGERHCDRFDRGEARGLLIEIEPGRVAAIGAYAAILDRRSHSSGGAAGEIARKLYREFRHPDAATPLAVEGLMLELLASASRRAIGARHGRAPGWLARAREIIEEGLAGPLGVTGIAAAVGVHPVTLARAFRRAHGRSVGEYVRRLRLERAARELRESDASLAAIALANGFADQSHFSNLFRRHTGVTPSEFRRRASPA